MSTSSAAAAAFRLVRGGAKNGNTYKLPPGSPLRLRDTGFDALDLAWTEPRHGPLVLGSRNLLGTDGTFEVGQRGARGGLALSRVPGTRSRRGGGRHSQYVDGREGGVAEDVAMREG